MDKLRYSRIFQYSQHVLLRSRISFFITSHLLYDFMRPIDNVGYTDEELSHLFYDAHEGNSAALFHMKFLAP